MIYLEYHYNNEIERYKFEHINICFKFLMTSFKIIKHVVISDQRLTPKVKYHLVKETDL